MKTFKQYLNEMSAKIQHIGDFSQPNNMYHKGDEKIITKGAIKAERLWEKSEGNFKLIFINDPSSWLQMTAPIGGGEITPYTQEFKAIEDFFKKNGEEFNPDPKEITVIYTRNDNNTQPMTAWIMAHRFAHMISYYIEKVIKDIRFIPIMNFISDHSSIDSKLLPYKFATMRSAREKKLGQGQENFLELYHEFMAQYLMTGKVTLSLLEAVVDTSKIKPEKLKDMQDIIPKLNNDMNDKFKTLLDSLHNKVFML